MIENKNPSRQKNYWRGFGGAVGPPKSRAGLKPKNKACFWVKDLRICPGLWSQYMPGDSGGKLILILAKEGYWWCVRDSLFSVVRIMTVFRG